MISASTLASLVMPALVMTAIAPAVLVTLVWRDVKENKLW